LEDAEVGSVTGRWWHLQAEGYKTKADAEKAVANVKANAVKAEVVDAKE
jgi:hypothetical protein